MKRKIIISAICVILILGIIAAFSFLGITKSPKLSSFNNEKLYEVLTDYGLSIPDELSDTTKELLLNGGLKEIVENLETDLNFYDNNAVNYSIANDFYEDIKIAIERYYGVVQ